MDLTKERMEKIDITDSLITLCQQPKTDTAEGEGQNEEKETKLPYTAKGVRIC